MENPKPASSKAIEIVLNNKNKSDHPPKPVTEHPPTARAWDKVREVARLKHLSIRTEEAYLHWIRRFWVFYKKPKLKELGMEQIRAFLSHLAVHDQVSSSTQNQALAALLFLYRDVIKVDLPNIENVERAKRTRKLPVVFTQSEVHNVLTKIGRAHV